MITLYSDKADCCGCSACEAICPKNNIRMQTDDEGFKYPLFLGEEHCINCNLCIKVCPLKIKDKATPLDRSYYAGVCNDKNVWNESSSGGAFTAICSSLNDKNPIIFGARWDGFKVIMDYCEGVGNISPFRKSKYVSADPNKMYPIVKKFLNEDRNVIFSGTPCQINGLLLFLRKDYEKLLTIDFACHGQGSPLIFQKWIEHIELTHKKKLKEFKLREKEYIIDHVNSNCTRYNFEDGSSYLTHRDYYHHSYVKGLHMRKSCAYCKFAGCRQADFTLADFKNLRRGLPELDGSLNISTLICNTERSKALIENLPNFRLYRPNGEFINRYNPKLIKGMKGHPNRDSVVNAIKNGQEILTVIKKFCRIKPTEWVEYNCSEHFYRKYYPLLHLLDKILYKLHL